MRKLCKILISLVDLFFDFSQKVFIRQGKRASAMGKYDCRCIYEPPGAGREEKHWKPSH